METTQPEAAQVIEENKRWNLGDLFDGPDDAGINYTLQKSKNQALNFVAKYKGQLKTLSGTQLKQAFIELEALISGLYKVSQYVNLIYATDTANDPIKALVAEVDEVESEISNELVFFDLEIGAVSKEVGTAWLSDPNLAPYHYCVKRSLDTAQFNLSEKEEQLATIKNLTGKSGWQKLYNEITSAFQFEFELDGEVKKMNGSQLRALRQHKDPEVRRKAMDLFFSRYEENQLIFSHIYNNVVKDSALEIGLRGYSSAINVRNIGNDIPDAAVAALHDVTTQSYKLVQRYYKLKSKLLKLDTMTLADIYAPLPQANKKISWQEAQETVQDSFTAFDPEIGNMVHAMFAQNRIDVPVTPTKRGGAFCSSSTPDLKPYVLLNFLGRQRDVSTLAHELGHAVHDILCEKQPLSYYHPILPLAETASVFAEMMLTDRILGQETDRLAKQAILTDKLEDIFATSHRQNMFSRFEINAHDRIGKQLMSAPELCGLYQEELTLMFKDSVKITPAYHWEWAAIPHVVESPFYVYAYNFGNLLVMALYQQYKEEGQSFIPKYKNFLSMGSSASPKEITAMVNADIENPEFWAKSLRYIETLIDQLEALI